MSVMDPITVRHPNFDLTDLPRVWIGRSRLLTHYGNAGHVFIPLGEQFFIDTVKAFRGAVTDPDQRRDINAFIGQESVHKRAHEEIWTALRSHDVPVDLYARCIASVRKLEERLPATFRLSVTAALEHYTAAFGHSFLTEDLGSAVPDEMARLLAWHGLEELEHRAVAFDVLQHVDDGYLLRVCGFALATGLLVVVPGLGVALFAWADLRRGGAEPVSPHASVPPQAAGSVLRPMARRLVGKMGRYLVDYLRPSFHPHDLALPPEAAVWAAALADS